ncbi:MAG: RNA 2',3'-cyclic phosphodiesterase [Chitinophagales bacterium]|nr:RNA 2',3'-cyclic phosphodiesterase [Chitinophagales bacterium]
MKTSLRSEGKHRLFIGIVPSDPILQSIDLFREKNVTIKNIRWVANRNAHVTCLFIGERPAEELVHIKSKIEEGLRHITPFQLHFDRFENIKRDQRSGMLWARFKDSVEFKDLAMSLAMVLLDRQLKKDPIPHITVARYKKAGLFEIKKNVHWDSKVLDVKSIVLFESELKESGAEYSALSSWSL